MRVGILGSGIVGQTLGNGFRDLGYEVAIGSRSGKKINGWGGNVGTFQEIARTADIIVLCVMGSVAESVVGSLVPELKEKTVIDTTNPIAEIPAENGVLHYFTSPEESLMERLQKIAPEAHFVKAFNSVGNAVMVQPQFEEGRPTMFICGNKTKAKREVGILLQKLGWEVEDMGMATAARAIEPLCMLWCIPGFRHNSWTHAFKLLK